MKSISKTNNTKNVVNENKVKKTTLDDAIHFYNHKEKLPADFGKTLSYHMKKSKLIKSNIDLSFLSDISERTIQSYLKNHVSPRLTNIIKISLALQLSNLYIIDLIEKGIKRNLDLHKDCQVFLIMSCNHQQGLYEVYKTLQNLNLESLLKVSSEWISLYED